MHIYICILIFKHVFFCHLGNHVFYVDTLQTVGKYHFLSLLAIISQLLFFQHHLIPY